MLNQAKLYEAIKNGNLKDIIIELPSILAGKMGMNKDGRQRGNFKFQKMESN